MAMETYIVEPGTRVEANGAGAPLDISSSQTRTFFLSMVITETIEQQSLDLSIWGSADGADWGKQPLLKMPQRFYVGETRMVLDLTMKPEIKFIRAQWELNRWGRVAPTPRFVFGVKLVEVPAMPKPVPAGTAAAGS
jgi:hypothetical protein